MCEVSEKIFKEGQAEGRAEGRIEQAKSTAMHLADMGLTAETIAEAVEISVGTVKQWLDNRKATIQ